MKHEILTFKLKAIEGESHWLILNSPGELDIAIEEFLTEINQ